MLPVSRARQRANLSLAKTAELLYSSLGTSSDDETKKRESIWTNGRTEAGRQNAAISGQFKKTQAPATSAKAENSQTVLGICLTTQRYQRFKSLPENVNTDPLPGIRRTEENIAAKKRVLLVKECLSGKCVQHTLFSAVRAHSVAHCCRVLLVNPKHIKGNIA